MQVYVQNYFMMPSLAAATAYFFAGYAALTSFFFIMSALGLRSAGFVARIMASYMALMFCASYGALAAIVLRVVGQGGNAQWAAGRAFKWCMYLLTGIRFAVDDPEGYLDKTRPAVIIGNHQTELDVLMLGTVFPKHCSVTAKISLKHWPVLGWFMMLSQTIFIDRKNSKDARQAMAGAAQEIRNRNQSVYIFPEGTRSYSQEPELLPFKKGAFHIAVQAGVPVIPVVVANYSHVLSAKKLLFTSGTVPCKGKFLHFLGTFKSQANKILGYIVLEPIPTQGLTTADVDELVRTTRDNMLEELIRLTAQAKGQPISIPAVVNQGAAIKATGTDVRPGS